MPAAINISYKYNVSLQFIINGDLVVIDQENIKSVNINRKYDTSNSPVVYITMKMTEVIYARLLDNQTNSYAILDIDKYDSSGDNKFKTKYIKDNFIYIMPTDINYKKLALDNETIDNSTDSDSDTDYFTISFALLKMDIFNDNKTLINSIVKNSNNISIINHYFCDHKMAIEQFDYNDIFDTLIIPPIKSKTGLLQYLNNNHSFYESGDYRFFMDFDVFYLLSNKGNYVNNGDNQYHTVIINVDNEDYNANVLAGSAIDYDSKSYILNVSSKRANLNIDKYKSKSFNSILGVDTDGNTKQISLDLPLNEDDDMKLDIKRVPNGNLNYINKIKYGEQMSTVILDVTKTEIDNAILTPNKEYIVHNYSSYSEYDGRYILSYKKEMFVQISGDFLCITSFGLRKVD